MGGEAPRGKAPGGKWNFAARPLSNAIILRSLTTRPGRPYWNSEVHAFPRRLTALLCAVAFLAAGCHSNNTSSGYGATWVTLTAEPGDFTSYSVNIDSVTLIRNDGQTATALATAETVDFTKLSNLSELWGTGTIATGTFVAASIVLDYSSANIAVMVNGAPVQATVVGPTGTAVTTVTVVVVFDPANPLTLPATYATTAAQRLALNLDLTASTVSIDTSTAKPTVTVRPYFTAGISPSDQKLVRIRGPLINSSVTEGSYTVYVRPFHDEGDDIGSVTLFNDANTIYTLNGLNYVGTPGLTILSQKSASTTLTAAYATYEPTATPTATAGKWHAKYMIGGATLEDTYTSGLEGDVISRSGNTLTLRGATFWQPDGTLKYYEADSTLTVGPSTEVTADDNTTLTGLDYNSISVGQHVIARGVASITNSVVTLNASGSSTTVGSVRLTSTSVFGSLISAGANDLLLNLTTINDWPVSVFNFAGTGSSTANDASAGNYYVSTTGLTIPDTTAGDPVWADGLVAPYAAGPPDFNAASLQTEATQPASIRVYWGTAGTSAPFSAMAASGLTLDLSNASITSAVIRLGSESLALSSLPASPVIVAATGTAPTATGLPSTYTPLFSEGDPTVVGTDAAPDGVHVYSALSSYVTQLTTVFTTKVALAFEARGTYDRTTNTFTASSINVVL